MKAKKGKVISNELNNKNKLDNDDFQLLGSEIERQTLSLKNSNAFNKQEIKKLEMIIAKQN